jgi:hypothetical protein
MAAANDVEACNAIPPGEWHCTGQFIFEKVRAQARDRKLSNETLDGAEDD